MRTNIQYDFTSMNEFFNFFMTPSQLLDDLTEMVLNYALSHDENQTEVFKRDIDTLYVLIQEHKAPQKATNSITIILSGRLHP